MSKDPKKQRVPTITAGRMADMAVERIEKDKKYAIAKETNKKFSLITAALAKNAGRVKELEKVVYSKDNKPAAAQDNTLQALASSMNTIAMSMQNLTKSLSKVLGTKATATSSTNMPQAMPAPAPAATAVASEDSSFSLLKSFFTNPAVVAAMAGIVYFILPKDMQDKVKSFLGGFAEGVTDVMGKNEEEGFSGVNTALKAAGIALTTYFGAKVIGGVASAITTSLKILKILGGGKALRGLAVAAGAVGVGVAANAAVSGGKKKSATDNLGGGGGGAGAEQTSASGIAASAAGGGGGLSSVASKFIAAHEGLPKGGKAMWDPPGQNHLVSVGYGHQIQESEYKQGFIQAGGEQIPIRGERGIDTQMTKEQAATLLAQDLPKYEKRASAPLGDAWNKLNDNQKAALISYAYNTGSTASLVKNGLKDAILAGDMATAEQIIRDKGIRTAGGQVLGALVRRRADEAALFAMATGGKAGSTSTASAGGGGAAAAPEPSSNKSGAAINDTSQNVKAMQKPDTGTDVANVENTTTGGDAKKKGPSMPASIPTPIASRGSLKTSTRHSAAY